MDGGRRLLRSLKEVFGSPGVARPALAGISPPPTGNGLVVVRSSLPVRRRRTGWLQQLAAMAARPGLSLGLAVGVVGGAVLFGAVRGGQYDLFVATYGSPFDFIARNVGFALDAVTIAGTHELTSGEVLATAGLTSNNSLLFLDAAQVRDRLRTIPLVKDASVRKFYPNRLLIEIEERRPFALWQRDGQLRLIAEDSTEIESGTDPRYNHLPFVVGDGAQLRVPEFMKILEAAEDLKPKIQAGILVGMRRWDLKLSNGMQIMLPENGAEQAVSVVARLAREGRLLDKDILTIDARLPGRIAVRLTEEAAAARADLVARRKGKGGPT